MIIRKATQLSTMIRFNGENNAKINNKKDTNATLSTLSVTFCTCSWTPEIGFITSPGATKTPFARMKPGQFILKQPVASYPSLCSMYDSAWSIILAPCFQ